MSTRAAGHSGGVPQMWSGVSDEGLVPDAALPSQFADIWHRTRAISPERALALAVLQEAVVDLEKYRFAKRRRQQRMFWEAYEWIVSNDRRWPFSYINLCELIGMDADSARKRLLGEMAPPRREEFPTYQMVEAA